MAICAQHLLKRAQKWAGKQKVECFTIKTSGSRAVLWIPWLLTPPRRSPAVVRKVLKVTFLDFSNGSKIFKRF